MLDLSTPCVPWMGRLDRCGYGTVGPVGAHRIAYVEAYGPIPAGHQVGHACHDADLTCPGGVTCPHRACVNPLHLEAQTPAENTLRGIHGRRHVECLIRDECLHGHPWDGSNIYVAPSGKRECRCCVRDRARRYKQRKRAT